MDNFQNLENLQKELDELQRKFNEYTGLLETTKDLPLSYRKRLENQIGRTSCDIQNAKENIDLIRNSMKDGFIARFIDLIEKTANDLKNIQPQLLVLGLVSGMINPFRKIRDFLLENKVGEYFEDVVDFSLSLLTGIVRYLKSDNGVIDDLKINLYGLIELFDRAFLKDEFKIFEKMDEEMKETQHIIILIRSLLLSSFQQFGFDPKDRLLDFFMKYDRADMKTEIGTNLIDSYKKSSEKWLSIVLIDFMNKLEKLKKEEEKKNKRNDDDDDNDENWGNDGNDNENDDPYDFNCDNDDDDDDVDDDDDNERTKEISFVLFSGCGNISSVKRSRDNDDNDDNDDNKRRKT